MSESKASLQKDRERLRFLLQEGFALAMRVPAEGEPPADPDKPRFVRIQSIEHVDALMAAHRERKKAEARG